MHTASDPCRYVLSLAATAPAGREYFYNTGALHARLGHHPQGDRTPARRICARAFVRASGHYSRRVESGQRRYRRRRRIAPPGRAIWQKSASSSSRAAAGTTVRSFPKDWIETSTAPKFKATENQSCGYLWWLGRSLLNGREVHWVGAFGRGGQSIRIVPGSISLSW